MIRVTVFIPALDQLKEIFLILNEIDEFQAVKIINELHTDEQKLTILYMFQKGIICEVQMTCNEKLPQYYPNKFLD